MTQVQVAPVQKQSSNLSWVSLKTAVAGCALAACAGVTVFSSAQVMMSSHSLAELHAEQNTLRQEIRVLETTYASVGALENVRAYAAEQGLTQPVTVAGNFSGAVTVAHSAR